MYNPSVMKRDADEVASGIFSTVLNNYVSENKMKLIVCLDALLKNGCIQFQCSDLSGNMKGTFIFALIAALFLVMTFCPVIEAAQVGCEGDNPYRVRIYSRFAGFKPFQRDHHKCRL